jgi:hypothetical protein
MRIEAPGLLYGFLAGVGLATNLEILVVAEKEKLNNSKIESANLPSSSCFTAGAGRVDFSWSRFIVQCDSRPFYGNAELRGDAGGQAGRYQFSDKGLAGCPSRNWPSLCAEDNRWAAVPR